MDKILYVSNSEGEIAIGYKGEPFLTGGDNDTMSSWRCDSIKKAVTYTHINQFTQGIEKSTIPKIKTWFKLNINNLHKFAKEIK